LLSRMRGSHSSVARRAEIADHMDFHIGVAASVLRGGGVVAHATEGVWGLACDPADEATVLRILEMKQRPASKGLILIGAEPAMFQRELAAVDAATAARVVDSWPGAETWLLPNREFPPWITGSNSAVAVRVPGHAQARRLSARFGAPLVSTSANRSGRPAARNALTVRRYFGAQVDYILPGSVGESTTPSRITDATSGRRVR
jgi:L-threonylcarbamoyladenylate synthase